MSWLWPSDIPVPASEPPLMGLSVRLTEVGRLAKTDKGLADIGTDHGRLPIAVVAAGWASWAVAIDRATDPLASARRRIEKTPWAE